MPVRGSDLPCVLDDTDVDLAQWRWKLNNKGYVVRNLTIRINGQPTRYQTVILHRLVAKRAGHSIDGAEVDHEDRDKLNNRRSNLRVATRRQNCANTSLKSSNKTGCKGVFRLPSGKYQANIRTNGKRKH